MINYAHLSEDEQPEAYKAGIRDAVAGLLAREYFKKKNRPLKVGDWVKLKGSGEIGILLTIHEKTYEGDPLFWIKPIFPVGPAEWADSFGIDPKEVILIHPKFKTFEELFDVVES